MAVSHKHGVYSLLFGENGLFLISQTKNAWRLKLSQVMAAIPMSLELHCQIKKKKKKITRDTATVLTVQTFRRWLVSPTIQIDSATGLEKERTGYRKVKKRDVLDFLLFEN
jgi:hypothetical protein